MVWQSSKTFSMADGIMPGKILIKELIDSLEAHSTPSGEPHSNIAPFKRSGNPKHRRTKEPGTKHGLAAFRERGSENPFHTPKIQAFDTDTKSAGKQESRI